MPKLASIALVLLLTASGCCCVRLSGRSDDCICAPGGTAAPSAMSDGAAASTGAAGCPTGLERLGQCLHPRAIGQRLLHPWAKFHAQATPPAPVPPPNPKYHPVPTRPVFAPQP